MKLPRFKISNEFYNPTYLALELSQVMIKPAKKKIQENVFRVNKPVRGLKTFQTLKQTGNILSQSKEASFFTKEIGKLLAEKRKLLFNIISGGA